MEQRLILMNSKIRTKFQNMSRNKLKSKFQKHLTCCPKQNSFLSKKLIEEFTHCDNTILPQPRHTSIAFSRNLDIYLIDKKLYSNYASNIMNKYISSSENQSNVIFVDHRVIFFLLFYFFI